MGGIGTFEGGIMIRKYIEEGEVIPTLYARAWWDWERDVGVAYPILIHFIIRYIRELWILIRISGWPTRQMKHEQAIFQKGLTVEREAHNRFLELHEHSKKLEGYREGYNDAISHIIKIIEPNMLCKHCARKIDGNETIWRQVRTPMASEDNEIKQMEYDNYHLECAKQLNLVPKRL